MDVEKWDPSYLRYLQAVTDLEGVPEPEYGVCDDCHNEPVEYPYADGLGGIGEACFNAGMRRHPAGNNQ